MRKTTLPTEEKKEVKSFRDTDCPIYFAELLDHV